MYPRHNLVWLSAEGWRGAHAGAAPQHREALSTWQRGDWPLVARRREPGTDAAAVCLGLPLPPAPGDGAKVRIALNVPATVIRTTTAPLLLKDTLPAAPPAWRGPLRALADEAVGLTLRVYGSLAMQALTELPYTGATSDIDLLFYPSSDRQLKAGMALLKKYSQLLPLDGEIVFPRGAAVAWKEWLASDSDEARVLVKEADTVRLTQARLLTATLKEIA